MERIDKPMEESQVKRLVLRFTRSATKPLSPIGGRGFVMLQKWDSNEWEVANYPFYK